ncbi:MAG TPA: DNA alkylation repair protein, partial [Chitinophagaceae bacterium]|nr:DNA alkylation repair protein [Chitinophagaceae bacterium]
DPSEYVRRSVANNLNDISKDNPGIFISIAQRWKGYSKETNAIIKHGSRTLLKQGSLAILKHFGLTDNSNIVASKFNILTPIVKIGDNLEFTFSLQNTDSKSLNVRIEYAIHYLRSNKQHSKKVFKISERNLLPGETIHINRKQSFKIITTRRFYAGPQKLSLIINGKEKKNARFELKERRMTSPPVARS